MMQAAGELLPSQLERTLKGHDGHDGPGAILVMLECQADKYLLAPQAAGEPLPSQLEHTLKGHGGPVLAVRFNRGGTYCLSAGRVCTDRERGQLAQKAFA